MSGSIIWQTIGWIALILNVYGNLQLTGKTRVGWLTRLLVNVLWIIYSANQQAWPLLANHAVFVPINIYGWIKWRKAIVTSLPVYIEAQRLRNGLSKMEVEFKNQPYVVQAIRRLLMD